MPNDIIDPASAESASHYIAMPPPPPPPVYISGEAEVHREVRVYSHGRITYLLPQAGNLHAPSPPPIEPSPIPDENANCCTPARIKNSFYGAMTGVALGLTCGLSFTQILGMTGLFGTLSCLVCPPIDCDDAPAFERRAP
jgi:hypothetical protein